MRQDLKKKALSYLEQFRHLKQYLDLAGIKHKPSTIYIYLYVVAAVVDLSFLIYFSYVIYQYGLKLIYIFIISFLMLTLGYFLIFMIIWLLFLIIIDYLKFKRKLAVEDVLPEFLRLVSANHRAGLPLDMSIWKANRPRFGILAEEINDIAKQTYAKGDLIEPLQDFAKKYDSALLKRVITNIVEGLKTGADIAGLLDDIANNINTIKNTRKELASEVENYMLFIMVAVLIISPLMFALTHKMSGVIESVKNTLASSLSGENSASLPIQLSLTASERPFTYFFDVFVYFMLATNSVISVLLMSVVKYGNVKQDIKRIPVFYVVGLTVYILSKLLFSRFLPI